MKAEMQKAVIAINDERILQMLNNRDEQALRETAERYGALCRSAARNILGNSEDAEECFNDALMQIWNSIPPMQPENYCAYLLKIVRNAALDRYRSDKRLKRGGGQAEAVLDELSELLPAPGRVEQELERRELLAAIKRFLQSLPPKKREIFIRRYWHFSSCTEIAEKLGMRENTVQAAVSRTRKKLLAYLRKEGLL